MQERKAWWVLGATVAAVIGAFVSLFAGWVGVRDQPSVAAQVPYLVTGGGAAILLMVAAVGLGSAFHREWMFRTLREDVAVLQDQVDGVLVSVQSGAEDGERAAASVQAPAYHDPSTRYDPDGDSELAAVGGSRRRPLRARGTEE